MASASARAHTVPPAGGALADALRAADRAAPVALAPLAPVDDAALAPAARLGAWSAVVDWPVLPVHAALLPTGRVLAWDATPDDFDDDPHTTDNYTTRVTSWDPVTGSHRATNNGTDTDLFCAGSALLWDGRVLFAGGDGGRSGSNGPLSNSNLYDPWSNRWTRTDDLAAPRWYSSVAALGSGEMLTFGGTYSPTPIAEVFQFNKQWRPLPIRTPYTFSGDYSWLQATSDGDVMYFGPHDTLGRIETDGEGLWRNGPARDREGYRGYGSYAMYDVDRVLVAGGGDSLASSVVVDTRESSTVPSGSMTHGRRQHNLTILADGSVLASGGNSSGADQLDDTAGVLEPERWDPVTGRWTTLAPAARDRQYHSIALLLPDGRVLTGGGGYCPVCSERDYHEQNAEIYSPPYLFAADGSPAARPTIAAAPALLDYADIVGVATPDADRVARAHLIRLGSVTHSQNQSQRLVPLEFVSGGDRLLITTPANRDVAPPGHYLLIVVDDAGVPSIGRVVQVGQPLIRADEVVVNRLQGGPGPVERIDYYALEGTGEHTLSIDVRAARGRVDVVVGTGRMPGREAGNGLASCTPSGADDGATFCQVSSLGDETWYIGVSGAPGTDYTLLAHLADFDPAAAGGVRGNRVPAPSNARARTLGSTVVELSWDAPAGLVPSGYEIYRDGRLVNYRSDTRHVESSLAPGTSYRFEIVATDRDLNRSAPSAPVVVSTSSDPFDYDAYYNPLVPSTPVGLRHDRYSSEAIELFWQSSRDNGAVIGYEVHRDGQLLDFVRGPSYFERALTPGRVYRYFVVAVDNEQNRSGASIEIEVDLDAAPPPATGETPDTVDVGPVGGGGGYGYGYGGGGTPGGGDVSGPAGGDGVGTGADGSSGEGPGSDGVEGDDAEGGGSDHDGAASEGVGEGPDSGTTEPAAEPTRSGGGSGGAISLFVLALLAGGRALARHRFASPSRSAARHRFTLGGRDGASSVFPARAGLATANVASGRSYTGARAGGSGRRPRSTARRSPGRRAARAAGWSKGQFPSGIARRSRC